MLIHVSIQNEYLFQKKISIILEAVYRKGKITFINNNYKFHLGDKIIVSVNKKNRTKVLQKIKPSF